MGFPLSCSINKLNNFFLQIVLQDKYNIGALTVNIKCMWLSTKRMEGLSISQSFTRFLASPHKLYIYRQYTNSVYIYITVEDVKDILQTLKISYACGDDGINHQILKSISEFICIYLTIIFIFFTATERHIPFRMNNCTSFVSFQTTRQKQSFTLQINIIITLYRKSDET